MKSIENQIEKELFVLLMNKFYFRDFVFRICGIRMLYGSLFIPGNGFTDFFDANKSE